jgi:mannose-6-phosphate isomerase-like protein (cupin superfamily)
MRPLNKLLLTLFTFAAVSAATAQQAKSRVVRNDPSKLREQPKIHDGAGTMAFTQLFGTRDLNTNLTYLHAGVINANSSIGEHFHNSMEEMYVLLEGEAEFTINGRTSLIKAPALVPCRLHDAHGMYNTSGKTCKWLNFGVGMVKGGQGAFNLGDPRLPGTVPLDAYPQFISGRLERDKLRGNNPLYTGEGVLSRRIFTPDVFSTNWNNVDHVLIPKGAAMGARSMDGFEEIYYVVNGSGTVDVNGKTMPVAQDDAFYGLLGEKISIASTDKELELLVVCIASDKSKMPVQRPFGFGGPGGPAGPGATGGLGRPGGPLAPAEDEAAASAAVTAAAMAQTKGMSLQMDFVVEAKNAEAFENMYKNVYVPAMRTQAGYQWSKLIRIFPPDQEKKIQGEATDYNYQLQFGFDSEASRQKWVASEIHVKKAWPAAAALAKSYKWRAYDVMADDNVK